MKQNLYRVSCPELNEPEHVVANNIPEALEKIKKWDAPCNIDFTTLSIEYIDTVIV